MRIAPMNHMLQRLRFLRAVGMSLLLGLALCPPGSAQQQVELSGTVTTTEGTPIQGVSVKIRGTTTTTLTDAQGKYALTAPSDAVLVFSLIGYRGMAQGIGGRANINVAMERAISVLPEVVVTGYTAQRRADITGAVATVDVSSVEKQSNTSVLQRLDGRVAGVTVEDGGSPERAPPCGFVGSPRSRTTIPCTSW